MNIKSAKLIYFSPTGTTRKIIEGISQGLEAPVLEHIDLTTPDSSTRKPAEIREGLAIIGSPVYSGRLPIDAISRLRRLKGNGTPAVIVVAYGNRAYEDALLELRDVASEAGFKPIAAAAFIGEHSFSNDAMPIAVGRPDRDDLKKANEFGRRIHDKLRNLHAVDGVPALRVPGNLPYKERSGLSGVTPSTNETVCAKCKECAAICPAAAITVGNTVVTDPGLCIRCCACVKTCSTGARAMEDPRIRQVSEWLSKNCRERKEPETYI